MPSLSVIIPARNEMWLSRTVDDVLANARGETEIIAVLDGAWAEPGLERRSNLHVLYLPEPVGQRAATNLGAKISTADYVMKLDAHAAVGPCFDVELMRAAEELGDDVTQVPTQFNLHVFDWVCPHCGHRSYQGPTPTGCVSCSKEGTFTRDIVWKAQRRLTAAWRFDADLHFQYFGEYQQRPNAQGELYDVMSCLGACWFLSRKRFWALGGLDEGHGSWGQMGTEVACKAWLSGGRLVCNRRTWFSHMFRTQGGDFGFPYPVHNSDQEKARAYSRDLWKNNKWEKQVRPLSWLVDKFWPVPGWTEEQRDALEPQAPAVIAKRSTKGIVYYSDCQAPLEIINASLRSIERSEMPVVTVTLKPLISWEPCSFKNIVLPLERGYLTMFKQILAGLEALDAEFAFFCEHDVLYHPSHFDFTPPNAEQVFYNQNVWKVDAKTGRALHYRCSQTSGLCASRELLVEHYRKRVALVEQHGYSRKMGFEPGTHRRSERVDDLTAAIWMSELPNVDIRHNQNLTPSRWRKEQFRDQRYTEGWMESDEVPGWGKTLGRFDAFLNEIGQAKATHTASPSPSPSTKEFLKELSRGALQQAIA